jgi:Domain of unknown function (DUF4384)
MKLRRTLPFALFLCIAPTSSFAVNGGSNSGTGGVMLRANVPMGTVLNTGDPISFQYQTSEDAAVLVFNIDSQGYVRLLYPTGDVATARGHETYTVPDDGAELVVDGETGVEFVFALAVDDPSAIDAAEVDRLRGSGASGAEPYRIDGDPFIAANMIAGELVRGVSRQGAYFGYTYFFVNQRVDYPCYLCGACDGVADDPTCTDYRIVQRFDRRDPLAYPLKRAYETVGLDMEVVDEGGASVVVPEGSDVDVNFYPYGVEARAVDPFYSTLWSDAYWYDPFYWYGPYYPYYSPGWSIGIGFGWGWGWWGGYYCSGWYAPCGYGYDPWCGYGYYYPSGGYTQPEKFKAKYKSDASSLTTNRTVAAQRDGELRIASKDVQKSFSQQTQSSVRTKTGAVTRTAYQSGRTKGSSSMSGSRVKTSIGGQRAKVIKSSPRGKSSSFGTTPGVKSTNRGSTRSRQGVGDVPRGGGGYKSRGTSSHSRGVAPWSGSHGRSSSGRSMKSSAPQRSYSSPSMRGGGSSSRGGGGMKGGGAMRGGGGGARSAPRGGKGR